MTRAASAEYTVTDRLSTDHSKQPLEFKANVDANRDEEFQLEYKLTKSVSIGEQPKAIENFPDGRLLTWKNKKELSEIRILDINNGECLKAHTFKKFIVQVQIKSNDEILIVFGDQLVKFDTKNCVEMNCYKFGREILSNILFLNDEILAFVELIGFFRNDRLQIFDMVKFKPRKTHDLRNSEHDLYTLEKLNNGNLISILEYSFGVVVWHPDKGCIKKIRTDHVVFPRAMLPNNRLFFNNLRDYSLENSINFVHLKNVNDCLGEGDVDLHKKFGDKTDPVWPLTPCSRYQDSFGKYFVFDINAEDTAAIKLSSYEKIDCKTAMDETAPKIIKNDIMLSLHLHPGSCQFIKIWQQENNTHTYQLVQVIRLEKQLAGNQLVQFCGENLLVSSEEGMLTIYKPETSQEKQVKWILENYQKILVDSDQFSLEILEKMFKNSYNLYLFCFPYALAHIFREEQQFRSGVDALICKYLEIAAQEHILNTNLLAYYVDIILELALDKKIILRKTKLQSEAQITATKYSKWAQALQQRVDKLELDVKKINMDIKAIVTHVQNLQIALAAKAKRDMIFGVLKIGLVLVGGQILDLISGVIDTNALFNLCPYLLPPERAEELFNSGKKIVLDKGSETLLKQAGQDPQALIEVWSKTQLFLSPPVTQKRAFIAPLSHQLLPPPEFIQSAGDVKDSATRNEIFPSTGYAEFKYSKNKQQNLFVSTAVSSEIHSITKTVLEKDDHLNPEQVSNPDSPTCSVASVRPRQV